MIAYRHPLPVYGSGPSVGEPSAPAPRKPFERPDSVRFDPRTRKWYLTTTAGFSYDAPTRAEVILKAYDAIKLREPNNPWSPVEAKQREESAVTTTTTQSTAPYAQQTVKELQQLGKTRQLKGWHTMTKGQLIAGLIALDVNQPKPVLELNPAEPQTEPAGDPLEIPGFLKADGPEAAARRDAAKKRPLETPEPAFKIAPDRPTPAKADGKRASNQGRTITVLAKENPKRPGSSAHTRFSYYKTGMTVAEFLSKGGTSADIAFDQNKGFIRLSSKG